MSELKNTPSSVLTMEIHESSRDEMDQHMSKTLGETHAEIEQYSAITPSMRTYLTYLLGLVMLLSTLTATIYFPLIPMLSRHFSVSVQAINLTVTVYAVFQAISPTFFASLADSFGRRPVLLGLICIYSIASLGLALNKNSYAALIALRATQSIGGSATVPIAYGIVADVAPPAERGKMLGPMLSTCNAISAVGPIIGGAVALGTGEFEWVFLALLVIALALLAVAGFTLPETSRNVVGNGSKPAHGIWRTWWSVLRPRHKNDWVEKKAEGRFAEASKRPWKPMSLLDSLRIIFYPDAAAVLLTISVSYCVYYTVQTAVPDIFDETYDFNALEIGCALLPVLAGLTIGGIVAGKLIDRNYATVAKAKDKTQDFPIECARYRNCWPFILIEVGLVVGFGWAVQYQVHPAVPLILEFFAVGMSTILTHTASALLVDIFPDASSTAYASGQVTRCGLSAASVAVLQPIVEGSETSTILEKATIPDLMYDKDLEA
ncbi:hypothetical protein VMCG_09256 [Cytospora schulzeri]|uniref:Major facilitator superfamily (MFS) profile domain-containing protein n=1 Tax=Cytospora schulzeri TaxID=448051 RepID=A0A423VL07_9PEZI|nr:hypothetical protein VMCG_09256 [Valsa malicola]